MEKKLQKIYLLSQFIDKARITASSLSNLVNNPAEGIHRIKCKFKYDKKKKDKKHVELNINIVTVFLKTLFLKII